MTIFALSSGGFVNLDNVTLWQISEKGELLGYQSGDATRCMLIDDPRDVQDVLVLLRTNARDVMEESGVTLQGRRVRR